MGEPTTTKTDPSYGGLKRDDTMTAGGEGCYPSNDPAPHGQGTSSIGSTAALDTKANLTPAEMGKRPAAYTTSVAPHGQESRNTA